MQTDPVLNAATGADIRPFGWQLVRILIITTLVWAAVGIVGALASYSDLLRRGADIGFADLLLAWWRGCLPLVLMSAFGYAAFVRWPRLASEPHAIAAGFCLVLVLFFPIELLYQAYLQLLESKVAVTTTSLVQTLRAMPKFSWFTDSAIMVGAYATLLVVASWRQRQLRELALRQAETDNLRLRLQLEQQSLNSLRAQLEPHFLFNALNAISALVRASDRSVALSALARLSELLRYAIAAGQRDWVSVGDELKFVGDYLSLQQLRYGERLRLCITGDDRQLDAIDCPPLLLQPLVENALRHDLDCHTGSSDIRLDFQLQDGGLDIEISNSLNAGHTTNPGLGLGLRNTGERLQLMYGDRASLTAQAIQNRFVVRVHLPRDGEA